MVDLCKIENSIRMSVDGTGNCLEATWTGEGGELALGSYITLSGGGHALFYGEVMQAPSSSMESGSYKVVGLKTRLQGVEIVLEYVAQGDAETILTQIITTALTAAGLTLGLSITFSADPNADRLTMGETVGNFQNLAAFLDTVCQVNGWVWGVNSSATLFIKPRPEPETNEDGTVKGPAELGYIGCPEIKERSIEGRIEAVRWILANIPIVKNAAISSNQICEPGVITLSSAGVSTPGISGSTSGVALHLGEEAPQKISTTSGGYGYSGHRDKAERYNLITHLSGKGYTVARALTPITQWFKETVLTGLTVTGHGNNIARAVDGDTESSASSFDLSATRGVTPNDWFGLTVTGLKKDCIGAGLVYSGLSQSNRAILVLEYVGNSGLRQVAQFALTAQALPTQVRVIVPPNAKLGGVKEVALYVWVGKTFDFRVYELSAVKIDTVYLSRLSEAIITAQEAWTVQVVGYAKPPAIGSAVYELYFDGTLYSTLSSGAPGDIESQALAHIIKERDHQAQANAVRHGGG